MVRLSSDVSLGLLSPSLPLSRSLSLFKAHRRRRPHRKDLEKLGQRSGMRSSVSLSRLLLSQTKEKGQER